MHWKTNISQFIRVCKTPSSRFTTLWPLQVVITLTSVSLFTRLSLLVVVFFFILACFVLFLSTASISQLPNVLLQVEKPEMQWNSQFSLWYIYPTNNGQGPKRLETLPKIWHFYSWFFGFLTIFMQVFTQVPSSWPTFFRKSFMYIKNFSWNFITISWGFVQHLLNFKLYIASAVYQILFH